MATKKGQEHARHWENLHVGFS